MNFKLWLENTETLPESRTAQAILASVKLNDHKYK